MTRKSSILLLNEFLGHDGHQYLDLAVDSTGVSTVAWLRRRLHDGQHLLIVSVAQGHFMKKELGVAAAQELYWELPDRLPPELAFPTVRPVKTVVKKKTKTTRNGKRKSKKAAV